MGFPLVVRMPYGGGVRAPELHDDSPETYYVHTPGVKVAVPATPADAKGLLAAAIRDPDPVVVLEPKLVYRTARGAGARGRARRRRSAGRASPARARDVTLVAWGAMVAVCERAADALAGEASVEVLDLRTLKPLDEEAVLASVAPDGALRRRPGGAAHLRVRVRGRGAARRAGDPRPPRARAPRDRLRRPVPVLAARGLVHALGRACRRRGRGGCSRSDYPPPRGLRVPAPRPRRGPDRGARSRAGSWPRGTTSARISRSSRFRPTRRRSRSRRRARGRC